MEPTKGQHGTFNLALLYVLNSERLGLCDVGEFILNDLTILLVSHLGFNRVAARKRGFTIVRKVPFFLIALERIIFVSHLEQHLG